MRRVGTLLMLGVLVGCNSQPLDSAYKQTSGEMTIIPPDDSNALRFRHGLTQNGMMVRMVPTSGPRATISGGTLAGSLDYVQQTARYFMELFVCRSASARVLETPRPAFDADRNTWTLFMECEG